MAGDPPLDPPRTQLTVFASLTGADNGAANGASLRFATPRPPVSFEARAAHEYRALNGRAASWLGAAAAGASTGAARLTSRIGPPPNLRLELAAPEIKVELCLCARPLPRSGRALPRPRTLRRSSSAIR